MSRVQSLCTFLGFDYPPQARWPDRLMV